MHKIAATLVHLLTASGVICSLFTFIAIIDQDITTAFLWLGLALFIDALDGPLARFVDTKAHLPRFSGERLDLIIDYLNYVVLPAFILIRHPMMSSELGNLAAALILLTSLFHFSDMKSKTRDGYFVGFPAIWNIVIFYLMAFNMKENVAFSVIVVLALSTFIPIPWVHPFRVKKLRPLTIFVVAVAAITAFTTVISGFSLGMVEQTVLIMVPVYFVIVSLKRNWSHTVY